MSNFSKARVYLVTALAAHLLTVLPAFVAHAQIRLENVKLASALMVVPQASPGNNKQDEVLTPQALSAQASGQASPPASFDFIGDIQLCFVFDTKGGRYQASMQDLQGLKLTSEQALQQAVNNLKRLYGDPEIKRANGGLLLLQSKNPDYDASYMLDKELWQSLLKQAPTGIVAALPRRGGLLFAPVADVKSVERLQKMIVDLYSSNEHNRISSALYLFKDNRWTVFQAPQSDQTKVAASSPP